MYYNTEFIVCNIWSYLHIYLHIYKAIVIQTLNINLTTTTNVIQANRVIKCAEICVLGSGNDVKAGSQNPKINRKLKTSQYRWQELKQDFD